MKTKVWILGASIFFSAVTGFCQSGSMTADQILKRVSETYQNLRDYHIVATQTRQVTYNSSIYSPRSAMVTLDLAVEKPSKVRLDLKSAQEVIIVGDGSVTWQYIPQKREYTKDEASASLASSSGAVLGDGSGGDFLTGVNDTLVSRYCGLFRYGPQATLERDKTLKFNRKKTPCYLVRISTPSGSHTLWVDKSSFLVLRHDEVESYRRANLIETDGYTIRLQKASVNRVLAETLFEFNPPAKAREVQSLGLPGETGPLVGKEAQDFSLKDLEGEKVSLSQFRGQVVLLDFWATWCGPCRIELPTIAKLYETYKGKGLAVLGVNNEGDRTVKRFFKKEGFSFPVLIDSEQRVSRKYGANAIPDVLVINRAGVIEAHYVGVHSERDLTAALRSAGLQTSQ